MDIIDKAMIFIGILVTMVLLIGVLFGIAIIVAAPFLIGKLVGVIFILIMAVCITGLWMLILIKKGK